MKRIKSVGSGVAVSHTVGFALGALPSVLLSCPAFFTAAFEEAERELELMRQEGEAEEMAAE